VNVEVNGDNLEYLELSRKIVENSNRIVEKEWKGK